MKTNKFNGIKSASSPLISEIYNRQVSINFINVVMSCAAINAWYHTMLKYSSDIRILVDVGSAFGPSPQSENLWELLFIDAGKI